MKYILFIFSLIVVIVSSCESNTKEIKLKRIDSLLNISINLNADIDSIEFDSISSYYNLMLSFNEILIEKLHGFPEDSLTKDKLMRFGSVEKGLKKLPKKLIKYQKEIEFSLNQLEALRKDVVLGFIEDEKFETYFDDEKKAINNISPEINKIIKLLNKHLDNYNVLLPDVKFYVISLDNN